MAKHGTARDDRRPTIGDLRTLRGKSDVSPSSVRADVLDRLIHERLRLGIVRLAGRVTQREIRKQEARHGRVLDDILGAPHHDGGNAVGFEVAGNEG